jgi:hypothetical protein
MRELLDLPRSEASSSSSDRRSSGILIEILEGMPSPSVDPPSM